MKNTNRQPSSGSVLLGMAAGAALGAVGTMAMAQNQRQVKRCLLYTSPSPRD